MNESSHMNDMIEHIRALSTMDRVMCSLGYEHALRYIADHINCPQGWKKYDEFPSGIKYWGWEIPDSLNYWRDGRSDKTVEIDSGRSMRILNVRVPGRIDKEILFVAHVCHPRPGANDNASGPAMMIELINYFTHASPLYSLRFLFTVEYWGTIAFCSRYESNLANIVAGISLDMVGADQDICGSSLIVDEIPHHLVSNIDLLLWSHLLQNSRKGGYRIIGNPVSAYRCDFQYYTGGSDHYILNDTSVGIPSTCLNTYPDKFYHTPDDTVDKISPDTLGLFFITIHEALNDISDFSQNGLKRITHLILSRFMEAANQLLSASIYNYDGLSQEEWSFIFVHLFQNSEARIDQLKNNYSLEWVMPWKEVLCEEFTKVTKHFHLYSGGALKTTFDSVPVRYQKRFKGPLSRNRLYERISHTEKEDILRSLNEDPLFFHKMDAGINYMNKYDLNQISWLLRFHYGGELYPEKLDSWFNLLCRHGLLQRILN